MPVKETGQIVNRQGLAHVFGITVVTVDAWRRKGAPFVVEGSKGIEWKFNTADVIAWRVREARADATPDDDGGKISTDEAERRKKVADAGLAELKLRQYDGQLVEAVDVESAWAELLTACKRRLLAIPTKFAPQYAIEKDASKIQWSLNDAITESLDELSRGDESGGTDSDDPKPRARKTSTAADSDS